MKLFGFIVCAALMLWSQATLAASYPSFSLFGEPKYADNFDHFDYVNPSAPKGGELRLATDGTFDSLNPFILKGIADPRIMLTFDKLMVASGDEIATVYGLLAEKMEVAEDKKSVTFTIRENALWSDGRRVDADDVVFTFDLLKSKGSPEYRTYYRDVEKAEKTGERDVTFYFSGTENRELPLIVSELSILPKHILEGVDFATYTNDPIVGSGPYEIKSYDSGRTLTFKRRDDYWGKDLPVNKGKYNFDRIRIDFYRDSGVSVEALKAGEYDFRREMISKVWAMDYSGSRVQSGSLIKEELPDGMPTGMQSFVFNTRRAKFSDAKTREALSYLMDFEWINQNLFYGAYARNRSFFGNSPFEAKGLPSEDELALLQPFKDQLPSRVFTEEYQPPKTDGSGNNRPQLAQATKLLKEAGWVFKNRKWVRDGQELEIEFLLVSSNFERIIGPIERSMEKIGIPVTVRMVDVPQYVRRMEAFDFDVVTYWFTQGNAPGNEQINYWHSQQKDVQGSKNYAGVNNDVVDALVEKLLKAKDMDALQTAARALDRVLQWNFYVIPQWYSRSHRVIYDQKIARPDEIAPYNLGYIETWWMKENAGERAPAISSDPGDGQAAESGDMDAKE